MKLLAVSLCLLFSYGSSIPLRNVNFADFCNEFVSGYHSLRIPDLALSYAQNIKQMPSEIEVERQITFSESANST